MVEKSIPWLIPNSLSSSETRGRLALEGGGAGIGIGEYEGLWLLERVNASRSREERNAIGRLFSGPKREAKKRNAVVAIDADPYTENVYNLRLKPIYSRLGIPSYYAGIPGPTAAQNPERLYEELKNDKSRISSIDSLMKMIAQTIDLEHLQLIQFNNSMHGTGMSINAILAEEVLPRAFGNSYYEYYRLMLAISADVSRVTSKLDYFRSTKWSLNKLDELLKKDLLDAVIVVDNTVVSAVKSVLSGLASKEELKRAWQRFARIENRDEAMAEFYSTIAKIAKFDPHQTNDLIVQATAPLTIVPAWGALIDGQQRELRASSAPWDYYNTKRATKGSYIVTGYLPGEQLQKIDFKTIAEELAITTLAPIEPMTVTSIIVVLGEEDRRSWESQGISMYAVLEKSFAEIGYDGPLDVLTLSGESGIWIYAIVNSVNILESKFELRPRGR